MNFSVVYSRVGPKLHAEIHAYIPRQNYHFRVLTAKFYSLTWSKSRFFDQNSKNANFGQKIDFFRLFDQVRVEISNYNFLEKFFQPQISRNTCLTQIFWKYRRPIPKAVPCWKKWPKKLTHLRTTWRDGRIELKNFVDFF